MLNQSGAPLYAQNMFASVHGAAAEHMFTGLLPDAHGFGQLIMAEGSAQEVKPVVRRSRYRGLTWDKKERRWRVRINVMGKQHHVGRYYSEVEAARAFDRAALCIYGELAITNFGLTAARQDPTPVSAHILMVKQEYDRFRKQQQEEQQAAERNAATLSLVASDPALQQLLQAQQMALGSPHGSSASAPWRVNSLSTSGAEDLISSCSAFSEPLPDHSALPDAAPVLSSDLLVLSNMDMGTKNNPSVPVTSSAEGGPANTDWLLGQLASLGISGACSTGPSAAVSASRPLAAPFNYPMSEGFAALPQQVQLGRSSANDVASRNFLPPVWPAGAAKQPQQLQAPTSSANGLLLWSQQGGLVSPQTPFGDILLQQGPTAADNKGNNHQAVMFGASGAFGGGAGGCGAAQAKQGLDLSGMLHAMQEEARLEALIREGQEQLAHLQQMRQHQHVLVMQQYSQ